MAVDPPLPRRIPPRKGLPVLLEKDVREDLAGGQDRAGRHHVLLRGILPRGRRPECLDATVRLILGAEREGRDDVGLNIDLLDPVGGASGLTQRLQTGLFRPGMQGARRVLGSVPNKVSHHAPCSVMIIRTT